MTSSLLSGAELLGNSPRTGELVSCLASSSVTMPYSALFVLG